MNDLVVVLSVLGFTLSLTAAVWLYRVNVSLAEEIERAEDKVMRLQAATAEAREAFYRYSQIHLAKGTPEGDRKAHGNQDLGDAMNHALKETGYREPGPLQQHFVNVVRQFERAREHARG